MKRSILTSVILASLAATTILATPALAQPRDDHRRGEGHSEGRGGERGGDRGEGREGGRREERMVPRPGMERREDVYRGGPSPRAEQRWDDNRYNGYWMNNRWSYGPPPSAYYREPGYRPGHAPWRRGAYLPDHYRGFVVDEYWRYHLRRPPYGYHWVRVGDDYLLVALASGLIFDIIEGGQ